METLRGEALPPKDEEIEEKLNALRNLSGAYNASSSLGLRTSQSKGACENNSCSDGTISSPGRETA
jgi:hypothetical protein